MLLLILRHADAENAAASDAERRLTPKGRAQAEDVARFCQRHSLQPEYLLTSPYRRAVETADAVAKAFGIQWILERFLASGMEPETGLHELSAYEQVSRVMIVGHQPDLGYLAASLVGWSRAENFPVPKASLTAIEIRRLSPGGGALRWCLPPELME